ncbi:MAG: Rieske 2Fe-2S domain-containing protein [Chthonomonadales bacterium]
MHKQFYRVAAVGELTASNGMSIQIGEKTEGALFLDDRGKYYATCAKCPHLNERIDLGHVEGIEVICRAHHLRFDLRNGLCTNAGGYTLQTFEVRVVDGYVEVGLWEDSDTSEQINKPCDKTNGAC